MLRLQKNVHRQFCSGRQLTDFLGLVGHQRHMPKSDKILTHPARCGVRSCILHNAKQYK